MTGSRRNLVTALSLVAFAAAAAVGGYFFFSGPLRYRVEGPASVPAPGVLLVADHWIHLDGLAAPPRQDADCRANGQVLQCALISRARLIELVAGKTVACDVKRYDGDDRNWGRCRVRAADASVAVGSDDLNRALVRAGWAVADQRHFQDYANDGARARQERRGMWIGIVAERRLTAGIVAGVAGVVDGDTIELQGVDIRLRGIDAPEAAQPCSRNGMPYDCGWRAESFLHELLAGRSLVCHVGRFEGDDRVWGRCGDNDGTGRDYVAGSVTLNEIMVAAGWAVATVDTDVNYAAAEARARADQVGLWSGEFVRPPDWRRGVR